jgi:excisionase family DNA binding protein
MTTKKTTPKTYTISEAAKKLGVTRAALHEAIKKGRLDAKWGETVQVIRKKSLLVSAADLKNYRVDVSHQDRGKKT